MIQPRLWEELDQAVSESFINDIKDGKVPDLPYVIIDQNEAKKKIEEKIDKISEDRFLISLLIANYGNGKTNILKYLKLYYKQHNTSNIEVLYYPADAENFDIIANLLKIVEENYTGFIVNRIKEAVDSREEYEKLANNFEDHFSGIKEFTEKLFSTNDPEEIKRIFYLGTGRLNSKRYFDKESLRPLRDYEKRVILVLYLNILASGNKYVIFCIDEVEKISGKSKARFSHFLTSLRELIDLSNKIKGHYLILAMTDKTDSYLLQSTNEALYSRIHQHIIPISPISKRSDKVELIDYLKKIFNSEIPTDAILGKIVKENLESNRTLIQKIAEIIFKKEEKLELSVLLKRYDVEDLFYETKQDLKVNVEAFKNIHRKFFDPLEYYLENFNVITNDYFKSQLRYYYNIETDTLCYFIFSGDNLEFENEFIKIKNLVEALEVDKKISIDKISFFVPTNIELNYSRVKEFPFFDNVEIKIIDIDSFEDLFTLLELYRLNFDRQEVLKTIIESYTNSSL